MKIDKYNFVQYQGKYYRGDAMIGINKSGLIRLSSGFCRETNTNKYKYAVLFYDKSNRAIAIQFTNAPKEGSLTVTADGTAAAISGKAFFSVNNLSANDYFGRYNWSLYTIPNIGEVYIIELKK